MKANNVNVWRYSVLLLCSAMFWSCEHYLETYPRSFISKSEAFATVETAESVALRLYSSINGRGFANGSDISITLFSGLSADELANHSASGIAASYREFYENALVPTNANVAGMWAEIYRLIYQANVVIEGVRGNGSLPEATAGRLKGEALFMRAFGHFYLVNLFGEIPLALSTDYRENATKPKSSTQEIWESIRNDLSEAKALLPTGYSLTGDRRIRVGRWAAAAMLARVCLYMEDWEGAEREATEVIGQRQLFKLEELANAFLEGSEEAIWQLVRYSGDSEVNAYEGLVFGLSGIPRRVALASHVIQWYEPGDRRREYWVGDIESQGHVFHFPNKYKARSNTPVMEHTVMLRLGEQYLIRAEARAHQGKFDGCIDDLNSIRGRAGLAPLEPPHPGQGLSSLLDAVMQERRVEMLAEWGHRWLDLKRTGNADGVLAQIKPKWQPTAQLYPIPQEQLLSNPSMRDAQNPGY